MNEQRKKWQNQAAEAEILECIALDASSILRSAVKPSKRIQIVSAGQELPCGDEIRVRKGPLTAAH